MGERPVYEETQRGLTLEVWQDEDSPSPLNEDDPLRFLAWHPRWDLGHREDARQYEGVSGQPPSRADLREEYALVEPLYAYEHGAIQLSLDPYADPWDSGQIGWAAADAEALALYENDPERLLAYGRRLLRAYNQYLLGDVYGFRVIDESTGRALDSLWGIYGAIDEDGGALTEGRRAAARLNRNDEA